MADETPEPELPPIAGRHEGPPLLDYPSPPPAPEPEREPWGDVVRAAVVVFTSIGVLFFGAFGLCGLLGRGCG